MPARNGSDSAGASSGRAPSRDFPRLCACIDRLRFRSRYGPNAPLKLLAGQHDASAAGFAPQADVRADARYGPGVASTGVRLAEDDAVSRQDRHEVRHGSPRSFQRHYNTARSGLGIEPQRHRDTEEVPRRSLNPQITQMTKIESGPNLCHLCNLWFLLTLPFSVSLCLGG